jgi:hypothetical protein
MIWVLVIIVMMSPTDPSVVSIDQGFATYDECKSHMEDIREAVDIDTPIYGACVSSTIPGISI